MIGGREGDLDEEEAIEHSEEASSAGTMLSMLSSLRLACNSTSNSTGAASTTSTIVNSSSSISSVKLQVHILLKQMNIIDTSTVFLLAKVLEKFVSVLRMRHPAEKLVIVSSFTSTLDLVESLASRAGWGPSFRLDGQVLCTVHCTILFTTSLFYVQVPVQKRQPMVDQFNSLTDRTFLFLLSCKAGGVGINLCVYFVFTLNPKYSTVANASFVLYVFISEGSVHRG